MKRFWQNNKRQLIGIVVIILVAGVLTYISYDFMNWISIMLAIPAFSMSFIVLNQFNLGSDLNKAIESELENRRIKSSEIKKFINIVDEELGEVKNSLRNIEKYYTMQNNDTSSKTQIQPKFLTDTRESLEKYKKFQQKTFDFVKKRVSEKEDISNKTNQENPYSLTSKELSDLEDKMNIINNNYFKELKEVGPEQFEAVLEEKKKNELKEFFIDSNCFSIRYIKLVEKIQVSIGESED
jgi:hypothetical protein